ncbi:MAG TPA: PepSY domain-containing protein [Gemmatimonadales bacterium]|nr:PepSY domain-containing protein [Gemmatimonadales bacterium]
MNMMRKAWLIPVLAAAAACWGSTLAAQDKDEQEGNQAAVAKAVLGARVPLERGLAASASHGQAISAKFEIEDGKLQLSVYTVKDGKFFEVVVDHNTGKVVKAEPIAEGEDYTAAQSQKAAMAKATGSLRAAVEQALRDNAGYHAVSVTPSLKDGRAVADVTLAKGEEGKTVSVPL